VSSARRTRTVVLVGAVSALALLALPAQAGSSGARFTDPAGDMAVPSLDVLSGAIRIVDTGKVRTLSMTATMNGDLTGVPADYDLVTGIRQGTDCISLATRVRWNGAALAQSYQRTSTFPCQSDVATPSVLTALAEETVQYAVGGDPVTATAAGRSVTVTLPAPAWLRPGSLAGFGVLSHTPAVGTSTYIDGAEIGNYDLAGLDHEWRIG
jgi:hypothetical protein